MRLIKLLACFIIIFLVGCSQVMYQAGDYGETANGFGTTAGQCWLEIKRISP